MDLNATAAMDVAEAIAAAQSPSNACCGICGHIKAAHGSYTDSLGIDHADIGHVFAPGAYVAPESRKLLHNHSGRILSWSGFTEHNLVRESGNYCLLCDPETTEHNAMIRNHWRNSAAFTAIGG